MKTIVIIAIFFGIIISSVIPVYASEAITFGVKYDWEKEWPYGTRGIFIDGSVLLNEPYSGQQLEVYVKKPGGIAKLYQIFQLDSTGSYQFFLMDKSGHWPLGETEIELRHESSSYTGIVNVVEKLSTNNKSENTTKSFESPLAIQKIKGIPSWVKNNAAWWADGSISDHTFKNGIEFLVNDGIITVEPSKLQTSSNEIPSWVKNNAAWWADGIIEDSTFVSGIQFLVNDGIIKVKQPIIEEPVIKYTNNDAISPLLKNYQNRELTEGQKYWTNMLSSKSKPNPNSYAYQTFGDYSKYYSGYDYGYEVDIDKEVQYALKRADIYANQANSDLEKYAKMWANGEMSYEEYERKGMALLDSYSNQYANEMQSYWDSKYGYYP